MAAVVITFSGDDARLRAMHDRMLADQQKLLDKYAKLGETSKKLSKEEIEALQKKQSEKKAFQNLQNNAIKVIESLTTAEQKHTAKLAEANQMKKQGLLTDAQHSTHVQKLTADYQQLNTAMEKPAGSLDGWVGKVAAVATAYISVDKAIQLVNGAMERQIKLQDQTMSARNDLAIAQESAVKNLASLPPDQMAAALKVPLDLSKETGFRSPAAATQAMGELFSTVNDVAKNESALRAGMELTKLSTQDVGAVSSGLLKLQDTIGLADAKQASGFMVSFGVASPINNTRMQAEALAPVVEIATSQYPGVDKQQIAQASAGILATLTEKGSDKEGRESSTAAITLISKIKDVFATVPNAPGTLGGQISMLQQSEELRQKLFATEFGEQKFKKPMRELLTGGTETAQTLAEKTGQIGFSADMHNRTVDALNKVTTVLGQAQIRNRMEGNRTNKLVGDDITDAMATIRGIRTDTLNDATSSAGGNLGGNINQFLSAGITSFSPSLYGDNPAAAAQRTFTDLNLRRQQLLTNDWDGVTRQDAANAQLVSDQLKELAETLKVTINKLKADQQIQANSVIKQIDQSAISAAARLQAAQAAR